MLFRAWNEFSDNPPALVAYILAFAVAIVIGLCFHEFSHAWSAYRMGDTTAQRAGRLTLNPAKHLDPLGTFLMLVVGFGMAKPTPVVPSRLSVGPPWGLAITKAAGPASNFLVAAIAALPLKSGLIDTVADFDQISEASGVEILGLFLLFVAFFNVILGVFNLLPIPMLDGFAVLTSFFPRPMRLELERLERNAGYSVLMLVFILPLATGGRIDILGPVFDPIFDIMLDLFL